MILSTESAAVFTHAARQEQHVVAQTLTRQATTVTTLVTLGAAGPATSVADVRPDINIYGTQQGLSSEQLGAILGSIAGAVVIIIVAGICLANRRRGRAAVDSDDVTSSYGTPSIVDSLPPPRRPRYPPRTAELIPGGAPYPTYRAVPIQNPRRTPGLKRVYV
ncbi:hypothetical protein CDD83_5421 [Cordyceps sp. RAO-2017]|nr:hypothetical protein CDD83_5421 [Cordyceps sp. RAO-2017]